MLSFRNYVRFIPEPRMRKRFDETTIPMGDSEIPVPQHVTHAVNVAASMQSSLSEAEGDAHFGAKFAVPQGAVNVINRVSGKNIASQSDYVWVRKLKSKILEWIFKEGVRQAAVARRQLAEELSQELGTEIKQYEVFSKHPNRNPALHGKEEEIIARWFEKYEPDVMAVDVSDPNDPVRYFNIPSINALLEEHGEVPLEFGGPHGLLEFLETGRDPHTKEMWQNPKAIDPNAPLGRHGLDCSLPTDNKDGFVWDEASKKWAVVLGTSESGGYVPPTAFETYEVAMREAEATSTRRLDQIRAKQDSGEPLTHEEQRFASLMKLDPIRDEHGLLQHDPKAIETNPLIGGKKSLPDYFGLSHRRGNQLIPMPPEAIAKAKKLAEVGLREKQWDRLKGWTAYLGNKGAYYIDPDARAKEEAIRTLLDFAFTPEGVYNRIKVKKKDKVSGKEQETQAAIRSWITDGARTLQKRKELPDSDYNYDTAAYGHPISFSGTKPSESGDVEKSIEKMISQGWVPLNLEKGESVDGEDVVLSPKRKSLLMGLKGTRRLAFLKRPDENSPWMLVSQSPDVSEEPHSKPPAMHILPDTASLRVNASLGASHSRPLDKQRSDALQRVWMNHPELFGDEIVQKALDSESGKRPYLASILGGVLKQLSEARSKGLVGNDVSASEYYNDAYLYVLSQAASLQFRWGDDKQWKKEAERRISNGQLDVPVDYIPEIRRIALKLLSQGKEPQNGGQAEGAKPYMGGNLFRQDVYEALLAAGRIRRSLWARQIVRKKVQEKAAFDRANKTGIGGAGEEEDGPLDRTQQVDSEDVGKRVDARANANRVSLRTASRSVSAPDPNKADWSSELQTMQHQRDAMETRKTCPILQARDVDIIQVPEYISSYKSSRENAIKSIMRSKDKIKSLYDAINAVQIDPNQPLRSLGTIDALAFSIVKLYEMLVPAGDEDNLGYDDERAELGARYRKMLADPQLLGSLASKEQEILQHSMFGPMLHILVPRIMGLASVDTSNLSATSARKPTESQPASTQPEQPTATQPQSVPPQQSAADWSGLSGKVKIKSAAKSVPQPEQPVPPQQSAADWSGLSGKVKIKSAAKSVPQPEQPVPPQQSSAGWSGLSGKIRKRN